MAGASTRSLISSQAVQYLEDLLILFFLGPGIAFVSLFLTAGACLLLFLVILAGAISSNPVNQIYFLQADTSEIEGALPISRWTLWNICGVDDSGRNNNCGAVKPAFPFNPQSNFPDVTEGIPDGFLGCVLWRYRICKHYSTDRHTGRNMEDFSISRDSCSHFI